MRYWHNWSTRVRDWLSQASLLTSILGGRLDLTQCEAVLGVIEARSQKDFDLALHQLSGGLSKPLNAIRKNLIELLADIEAGLDFVDEDIEFISQEQAIARIEIAHGF